MESVVVLSHPLAGNCLKSLRNQETKVEEFRQAMRKLGLLLAVESTKKLATVAETVTTPLEVSAECHYVDDSRILLVPILRAGLGFVDSFLSLLPSAKVAHIGISRDHVTLEARPYQDSVPETPEEFDRVLVIDPMLATGNSSVKALKMIVEKGYREDKITFVCAVSVRRGIERIQQNFPQVKIITAVIDPGLNEKAYIVPGLGDAGDRLYLF